MSTFFLQQLINGLTLGSVYGLIAIGYTMVYGIIGMINFAHGEVYMISAYLCAIGLALLSFFGLESFPLLILGTLAFTIVVTGVYGWTIERIAYKPLRNSTRLAPLISAIGMSLILQNYAQLSQPPPARRANHAGRRTSRTSGRRFRPNHLHQNLYSNRLVRGHAAAHVDNQPYPAGADVSCGAAGSQNGLHSGDQYRQDHFAGLCDRRGDGRAGGVLITMNYGTFDFYVGFVIGIKAFTAAVLGGIGSLPGAMLGGLILGVAEAQFSGMVNSDYKDVFSFGLLVLILIFRPQGLLGRPVVAKV